jgi:hypothetical protein
MVDAQLLNDALITIAIACGAAIFLALSIVAIASLRQRRAWRMLAGTGRPSRPSRPVNSRIRQAHREAAHRETAHRETAHRETAHRETAFR